MAKEQIRPWKVGAALLQASQDIAAAASMVAAGRVDEADEAQEVASVSLASSVIMLGKLRLVDKRADYGVLHQQMLEFLPVLVLGGGDIGVPRLQQAADQLDMLARAVIALADAKPKPLDVAGALDGGGTDTEAVAKALERAAETAAKPLPESCPRGHSQERIKRLTGEIFGDVQDCVHCSACSCSYILLVAGWFECPKTEAST